MMAVLSKNPLDLAWSLKPVLYPLRIVGIDLHVGQPRSKFRCFAFLVVELLVAILVLTQSFTGVYLLDLESNNNKNKNSSRFWTKILSDGLSRVVGTILYLLCIPIIIFKNWEKLWKKMEKLHHRFLSFHNHFAGKLRKVAIILCVILFALVSKLILKVNNNF